MISQFDWLHPWTECQNDFQSEHNIVNECHITLSSLHHWQKIGLAKDRPNTHQEDQYDDSSGMNDHSDYDDADKEEEVSSEESSKEKKMKCVWFQQ
jgi:hypothetical protein